MTLVFGLRRISWMNSMKRSTRENTHINGELRDTTTRKSNPGVSFSVILFVGSSKLQDQVKLEEHSLPIGKIQFGYPSHLAMEPTSSRHLTESLS